MRTTEPMTRADKAREWLARRPGVDHRPRDLARAMGWSNHEAATTLRALWEKGEIERLRVTNPGASGPAYSLYGVK